MRADKVVMYRDTVGEWRWRYVRSNGRVMADSGEGYKNKAACARAASHVLALGLIGEPDEWQRQPDGTEVCLP